jgi:hypothetical protein
MCEEKMLWQMTGFGGLILFLIYLECTNNKMCNRVLLVSDNFKGPLFSMFSRIGVMWNVCLFFFSKFVK